MKYIIFDYDGTLHNSIKIYKPAFIKAYNYLVSKDYAEEREFKEEEISKFLGLSAKDMWNTFMPDLPKSEKEKCSSIIGESMIEYIDEGKAELYDGVIDVLNKLSAIELYILSLYLIFILYTKINRLSIFEIHLSKNSTLRYMIIDPGYW